MNHLNRVIQINCAASEELVSISEELAGHAGHLLDAVSFFKITSGVTALDKSAPALLIENPIAAD